MEVKTISGGALWSHSLLPELGSLAQTDATTQAGRATPSTALLKPCSFSSPFIASVLPSTLCIRRAVLFLHLPFPLHFKFLNLAHKSLLDLTPPSPALFCASPTSSHGMSHGSPTSHGMSRGSFPSWVPSLHCGLSQEHGSHPLPSPNQIHISA